MRKIIDTNIFFISQKPYFDIFCIDLNLRDVMDNLSSFLLQELDFEAMAHYNQLP